MNNAAAEFTFACPHCSQPISAVAADAGLQTQCPVCSQAFIVPSPPPPRRPFAGGPRHQTANASPPKITKRLLSVSAVVLLISISATLPQVAGEDTRSPRPPAKSAVAENFNAGDDVRIIRQATLTFNGKPFKEVQPGGTFKVVASRPAERRIYLQIKDATGKAIAVAVEDDAVVRVSLSERAIEAARTGNPKEALSLIQAARKTEPTNSDLARISDIIFEVANATENLKAAAQQQSLTMARVVQLEKNAEVANSPNALDSNDTSYRQRAAKILAEAQALQKAAKNMVEPARTRYEASFSALRVAESTRQPQNLSGIRNDIAENKHRTKEINGAKSGAESKFENTFEPNREDAVTVALRCGDLIKDMLTRRHPLSPVQHNVLYLGKTPIEYKAFIDISSGELFSIARSGVTPGDNDASLVSHFELDPFESRFASFLCDYSDSIENGDGRQKWAKKIDDIDIKSTSWKAESDTHKSLVTEFENLPYGGKRMKFRIVQKLEETLYEAEFIYSLFGYSKVREGEHFVLRATLTDFKSAGHATLPLKFVKKTTVTTKDGFDKEYRLFEEGDDTQENLVLNKLIQNEERMAAMLKTQNVDRGDLVLFFESLLAIHDSIKIANESLKQNIQKTPTKQRNIWSPNQMNVGFFELGFMELLKGRFAK